ncbi:MAG TPA: lmo0937 family membrane protein [Candidatus Paceibacterota bacterium]|nr:lmo0937 family membrane protein [Candidatus Paceibacterota bacterium]
MLLILAALLIILWAIGFATSFVLGGFIHLLLIAAAILIIMRMFDGKKQIPGSSL